MEIDRIKLFPKPGTVRNKDYNLYFIMSLVCTTCGLMGLILTPILYFSSRPPLALFGAFCFVITAVVWYFLSLRKLVISAAYGAMLIYLYSLASTLYFGWDTGFQYYLIALLAGFILFPYLKIHFHYLLNTIILVSFLVLYLCISTPAPLEPKIASILHTVNAGIALSFLAFCNYFLRQQTEVLIKRLNHNANTDSLTGLFNRRQMNMDLKRHRNLGKRYNNINSIISVDIDHFKNINDTYGHACGDSILKQFSELLRKRLRESDLIARWGGEEFLILTPFTNLKNAGLLAEDLRASIQNHEFIHKDLRIKITITLGVMSLEPKKTIEESLSGIDQLLYQGKASGRNIVIMQKVE